jgi:hypothetical protein
MFPSYLYLITTVQISQAFLHIILRILLTVFDIFHRNKIQLCNNKTTVIYYLMETTDLKGDDNNDKSRSYHRNAWFRQNYIHT